mmetsp:Transcript_31251/g.45905  ORF Transcript_31251/g.45905 Transcript_31251/m.45905 type:complete len:365 (+) Transcript_31251:64-1158(+)
MIIRLLSFVSVFTLTNALVTSPLSPQDIDTIARGGVAIIPNFLPKPLIESMRNDAKYLFQNGFFTPDGLTNTALAKTQQGFTPKADRQTFRGGADWSSKEFGDYDTRLEFRNRMQQVKDHLASELNRPSLRVEGLKRHEMTYNWYEPGAKLGRHLDEHHEETKGVKGWLLESRRSVTWLVYLNEGWTKEDGGALRTYPRQKLATTQVGAHDGNLQVGWIENDPVFLDCFRPSGQSALYTVVIDTKGERLVRNVLTVRDFDVPSQPIEFAKFLPKKLGDKFEQISTARLDPRFAKISNGGNDSVLDNAAACSKEDEGYYIDVIPEAGTLVLFDSVSLPHLVREVTGNRRRIAATGWFHEDSTMLL